LICTGILTMGAYWLVEHHYSGVLTQKNATIERLKTELEFVRPPTGGANTTPVQGPKAAGDAKHGVGGFIGQVAYFMMEKTPHFVVWVKIANFGEPTEFETTKLTATLPTGQNYVGSLILLDGPPLKLPQPDGSVFDLKPEDALALKTSKLMVKNQIEIGYILANFPEVRTMADADKVLVTAVFSVTLSDSSGSNTTFSAKLDPGRALNKRMTITP
jgi:hypothetical protein